MENKLRKKPEIEKTEKFNYYRDHINYQLRL